MPRWTDKTLRVVARKPCLVCEQEIVITRQSLVDRKKYCSKQCRWRGHAGKGYGANNFAEGRKCKACGIDYIARAKHSMFCSKKCGESVGKKDYRLLNNSLKYHIKLLLRMSGYDRKLLSEEFIMSLYEKQKGLCAITGLQMTWIAGKGHVPTNLSIDRISSFCGYTPDNVQLVCRVANVMKGRMSQDEFIDMCKRIVENNGAK